MPTLEEELEELKARLAMVERGVDADQILRSIAVNSPSNIMLLDRDARIRFINHTVPGITPEEMLGLCLLDIVEEEYRPGIRGALERVASTGEPDRYETSYTSPSGDVSWWESGVGPVLQEAKVTGFVVVSTNATEQRRRSEEQERFFNLSVDMMCVAGFDGYFKRVNAAFKATLGYGEELLTRPFLDFVHPDDVKATAEVVLRLAAGATERDFRNRYRIFDGSYRLLSWRGVGDKTRKVIYAVARDITDTAYLEEQLQQSRRMEAIGQLAGGIAHDFNNLLTAIQGNIELALDAPKTYESSLRSALEAVSRAAALTRQLLIFSHHQALSPAVLSLNQLLDDLMSLLKRLLPESIAVSLQHAISDPLIVADKSQLEQVVVNLCVNARDAMPDGGNLSLAVFDRVQVDEYAANLASVAAGDYALLSVTDSGCGMTPEIQARMFEPFFTTKEVGKGTGLGLATVYGIVQKHHGFVEVDSKLGTGTTIRVYFPLAAEGPPAVSSSLPPPSSVKGGTETILVAEDDADVRFMVQRMLEQAGYQVLIANDGLEAIHLFSQNPAHVSLALLDVVMPKLGGPETAARLRAQRADLKVIFVSGHVQLELDQRRLQAETLLAKPYRREVLLECIRRALDSAQG